MALYTYESPEPGDLTFSEGDVILVSKREGEWWNGSIGDRIGLFPGNYVKPKETDVRTLDTLPYNSISLLVLVLDCIMFQCVPVVFFFCCIFVQCF